MAWFILYVKSNCEKGVAQKLRERHVDVYCPLIRTKRKWSDRIKWVEEPLFRSYCFVKLEEHQRHAVFGIPGIVRYVFWQHKPAVVRDGEIEAIKQMLDDFDHEAIQIEFFSPNQRVKITSGFFTDTEGNVIYQQGEELTLLIDSLQVILKINVAKTLVSKLNVTA